MQVPAIQISAGTKKGYSHNFRWCISSSGRDLTGTDLLQDADIKGPCQDQRGYCLHVHSPFPGFFALLSPLPPYKVPCLPWNIKIGFEMMRVPHLSGGQHLNKTTFLYFHQHLTLEYWLSKQWAAGPAFS